ncbi:iron (metal) dependent repressor, DtxR family [Desulfocicer vacuolatum DSM 3385]|uniref:Transcriptional regulator MntR n=1 Tax=Desulfocicer vacuolatum DSM 3385 TaxID=1121400 RepID=A0A1W2EFC3_9BACT|nr:metal-dependent transcriptional regulator [Desulfocicer vacuolatum]SMD08355.1 iron (metal) dependent repressor, DtxR family [Desulfocicer vacuolatum DSM 3385]
MPNPDSLTASLEDYLETIYNIIHEKKAVRVKDIATRLSVQNPSVTSALKNLSKKGYVNYTPYDVITLTDKGETAALDIIRRHEVMKTFLVDILCLDNNEKAENAACRMEHTVPPEVLERIIRLVEFAQICPRSGKEWISGFKRFCDNNFNGNLCQGEKEKCVGRFIHTPGQCSMLSKDTLSLTNIKETHKARLIKVEEDTLIHTRLETMGVTPGSLFLVENIDTMTGDMNVAVRGYHLIIRKNEADSIQVSPC